MDRTITCIPIVLKDKFECIKKDFSDNGCKIIENCSIADLLPYVDAYYGDVSASVYEFSKTGKPTIIQAYDLRWCSCPALGKGLAMQFFILLLGVLMGCFVCIKTLLKPS